MKLQVQVIVEFVMGQDVFAILPILGYAKSLCYACLPILYDDPHRGSNKSIISDVNQ